MRRADRLFQIVQLLRGGRVLTAADIAGELDVSPRTIYRDVADLIASGVPVDGEAGVGYCMARGFDLPPLMFDEEEIGALVLGARMVQAFGDARMARHARSLLEKIELVVPERLKSSFDRPALHVFSWIDPSARANIEALRRGIDDRRRLRFRYRDEKGDDSERTVRPLCMSFWGTVWTAGAWCELREDFRTFRPDRMSAVKVLDARFEDEAGKDLDAYLAMVRRRIGREEG